MWFGRRRSGSMMAPRTSLVALAALVAVLAVGALASAAPDDRTATEDALREVERSPKKDVAAEMTTRSRAALERAAKLRASGDEPHARLAEGLAKTWAEAARDVLRAVDIEEKAQAARRAATDAGIVAERERALLEEGIAQSGRLRAQLESTERESKEQPARTSAAANADVADGGAARPKAPKATPPATRDGGAR
jgi:hypothetical protein